MKKYLLEIDGKKYEVEVDLSGPNPSVLVNGKKIDVTIDNSNNLEKPKISRKQTKKTAEEKNDAAVLGPSSPWQLAGCHPEMPSPIPPARGGFAFHDGIVTIAGRS